MKTFNLIFVFFLSVFISSTAYNQECKDFLKSKTFKISIPKDFLFYGQSKSIYAEVHKTYKFELIFIGNEEYLMSIATEDKYGPVHFRIINSENKMVLFDNEKKKYNGSANFYMQKTQPVTIEVTIMATEGKHSFTKVQRVCLGIKINNRPYVE